MLYGWKEIATYLSRDVRTVRRWEKERGLPVRRTPGEGRPNVYIALPELDQWLYPVAEAVAQPMQEPTESLSHLEALGPPPIAASVSSRQLVPVSFLLSLSLVALLVVFWQRHSRPTHVSAAVRYISPVPGVDDLYLRGVYFYEQHTPASLAQSRQYLQRAVAKDPADAPAWSTLASTTLMLEQFDSLPAAQGFDEAGTAARRALALDPSFADAHATLAFVDFFWSHDSASAEREFRTALTLEPDSPTAHHRYGLMLLDQRRFPEALAQLDIALRLQPGSSTVLAGRALALGFNGHRDEGVQILQAVAAQQPQNPVVYHNLAMLAQMQPSNIPLYLDSVRRLQQIEHQSPPWQDSAARAYRSGGESAMWHAIVASESSDHVETLAAAQALTQLGQSSAALDILERSAQNPGDGMNGLALDPLFDPLHQDPRFNRILARLDLPPLQ
jgi:Tfp pilus assembly protein PilF